MHGKSCKLLTHSISAWLYSTVCCIETQSLGIIKEKFLMDYTRILVNYRNIIKHLFLEHSDVESSLRWSGKAYAFLLKSFKANLDLLWTSCIITVFYISKQCPTILKKFFEVCIFVPVSHLDNLLWRNTLPHYHISRGRRWRKKWESYCAVYLENFNTLQLEMSKKKPWYLTLAFKFIILFTLSLFDLGC